MNVLLFLKQTRIFIVAFILQVVLFQNIFVGTVIAPYVFVFFYPIAILSLPIRIHPIIVILVSFFFGILIDLYYGTIGIHTGALVWSGFIRLYLLRVFEPRKAYKVKDQPTISAFGGVWFLQYSAVFLFLHCLFFYGIEAFTLVFIIDILIKTILSTIVSVFFIFVFNLIFQK